MTEKILVMGEDKIQYYVAAILARSQLPVFYYGIMPYDKPLGVKRIEMLGQVKELLRDDRCLVVMPLDIILSGNISQQSENRIREEKTTEVTCKFWRPPRQELFKQCLADLLAEAAVMELKLLAHKKIKDTITLIGGFDVYAKCIAEKIRAWKGNVVIIAENEEEYGLASYLGYVVLRKEELGNHLGVYGLKVDFIILSSEQMRLENQYINMLSGEVVVLNITSQYYALDTKYAKRQHICVKHANHILLEYAPYQTALEIAKNIKECI